MFTLSRFFRWNPYSDRWLILIGIGKLLKALFFVVLGFGILKLLHKDIGDLLLHAAAWFRVDPENRFISMLLEKSALLNPHRLKQISAGVFALAALDVVEGVGLVMRKVWAEYFTLILTVSLLPLEAYEIGRHATWPKAVFMLLNGIVAVYLAWVVRQRVQRHTAAGGRAEPSGGEEEGKGAPTLEKNDLQLR